MIAVLPAGELRICSMNEGDKALRGRRADSD